MRGRKPKPTALRIAEGKRGHRPLRVGEPTPDRAHPKPPRWMNGAALEEWRRVVPELEKVGLLTVMDIGALEALCAAYGEWIRCHRFLQENGLTVTVGEQGYTQQRPEVAIRDKSWSQYRAYCSEFGLSPASRVRLGTQPKREEDSDGYGLLNGEWKPEARKVVQ